MTTIHLQILNSSSDLFLPLLICCCCCFFFFFFFKSIALPKEKRSPNLPPGPTPLPFIGNILKLGCLPHVSLRNLAAEHGPLIHLTLGQIPTIVASSKEIASEILGTQDLVFCGRPQLIAASLLTYGGLDIAFSPYNDHWKQIKRFSNAEFFCASKVRSFRAIRDDEVGILVSAIRNDCCGRRKGVDLSKMTVCLFNNVIYREVFGKRISADGECGVSRYQDIITAVMDLLPGFSFGDLFPRFWWLDWFTGWRLKLERSFREMDGLFDEEIRERKMKRSSWRKEEEEEEEEEEENFLDVLLRCEVQKHSLLDFLLSRNDTKALIMDLFFTATESAAVTIEWGMSELMKNPDAMKKAQEEVRRVVGAGKPRVEEDDLPRLNYLKLVINETFRLHPAAPLLGPHESMRDTKINGFDIPAKTRVIINGSAIGRDPKSWIDPGSFQPERFLNNAVNYRGNHYEFIPFGSGRRICPGMGHAVVGIELVFANLLLSFDWELPEGMKEKGLDMEEQYGLSICRKNPLILMAEPAVDVSI